MKAIVIDDERLALESMARILQRYNIDVVGTFLDPREAIKHHQSLGAEVAFVDIEMPELNGLELAARLQSDNPELHIVFVTAYVQYAVDAFEIAAVDYLTKPIQLKRLDITLKRLQALRRVSRETHESSTSREASLMTLCLFHHLCFQDSQGSLVDIPWRTTKAKELFAYMVHLDDRTPSKEEIIDRIWPDGDLVKIGAYMHTIIYQIRQTLKNASVPLKIEYKDGRYKLEAAAELQVDVRVWEKAVREAADTDDSEKMHDLLVNGYRGDYLETEGFLWAENERERLRALWLEHALRNAAQMEASASYSNAISLHQHIQARFPEIEESYFGLMRLYDKLGNTSEVRHQYNRLSRMLAEDLGMQPNGTVSGWFDNWNDRKSS